MPIIIFIIFTWIIWASTSTGGLYELKQLNPSYVQQNDEKYYLVIKLNSFDGRYFVDKCGFYMPSWERAEKCVKINIFCEQLLPVTKNKYGLDTRDIFSDQFKACIDQNKQTYNFFDYMRISRAFWRIAIGTGCIWARGGFNKNISAEEWDKKNSYWAKPLLEWMDKGM